MSKAPTRFGQRPNSEMGLRETAEEPLFLMRTRWRCPAQPQESYAAGVSCQSKTVENASKSPQTNLIDMRLNQNRERLSATVHGLSAATSNELANCNSW